MKDFTAILATASAAIALSMSPGYSAAQGNGRTVAPSPIEGSWQVRITPYICTTGQSLDAVAFDSMMTFGANGTLVETTTNPAFQPGQRSPGHGSWERDWRPSIEAVFQAFVHFDTPLPAVPPHLPYKRGTQRVELVIDMVDDDHWAGTLAIVFRTTAGAIASNGCARTRAARLL